MFTFIRWSTTNGVADHTSQMKECWAWMEDVLRQADRIAVERACEAS